MIAPIVGLAIATQLQAAELLHYTLAPESRATPYGAAPEPLAGGFTWLRCGDDGVILCFDARSIDFHSESISVRLLEHPNSEATSVFTTTNLTYFSESVLARLSPLPGNEEFATGLFAAGIFSGPALHPRRLEYRGFEIANWRLDVVAVLSSVTTVEDEDGDGVRDEFDSCPNTPHGVVVNADGCSIEQLVLCEGPLTGGPWKSHGQYVMAALKETRHFLKQGLITGKEAHRILREAVHSDCGRRGL